jgi:uncharacterized protein YlxW (UPF0749 family)
LLSRQATVAEVKPPVSVGAPARLDTSVVVGVLVAGVTVAGAAAGAVVMQWQAVDKARLEFKEDLAKQRAELKQQIEPLATILHSLDKSIAQMQAQQTQMQVLLLGVLGVVGFMALKGK